MVSAFREMEPICLKIAMLTKVIEALEQAIKFNSHNGERNG
jgi:hypothetical protein